MYAQQAIKVEEVSRELVAARAAVGSSVDVVRFVNMAVTAYRGAATPGPRETLDLALTTTPAALRDAVGVTDHRATTTIRARLDLPVKDGETYLSRTHPFVEGLASYVLTSALDDLTDSPAARAGAIRTAEVYHRTTLLLVRYRFDLVTIRGEATEQLVAEECETLAFTGPATTPAWLDPDSVERLRAARPSGNVAAEQAVRAVSAVVQARDTLAGALAERAWQRADELLASHRRVRTQSAIRGVRYRVGPHLPVDVLGVYVLLPRPTVEGQ
jgi:hypothetical protein